MVAGQELNNRLIYKEFCDNGTLIPVFSQWWWLDAVCGTNNWDVALVEKGGSIFGSLPYYLTTILKHKVIKMPLLTQTMGPVIVYPPGQKYTTRLSHEHTILEALIDQLPEVSHFNQSFDSRITNVLPFIWRNYDMRLRYTYVLEDLSDLEVVWSHLDETCRRQIRKAQKKLIVRTDLGIDDFLDLNARSYKRHGRQLPYSREFVYRLDRACTDRTARRIFCAEDSKGQICAAAYIVWDKNTAYYLMGGSDSSVHSTAAGSLVIWAAIEFAASIGKKFDFEGSVVRSIERFFRGFGARQKLYINVRRSTGLMKQLWTARRLYLSMGSS